MIKKVKGWFKDKWYWLLTFNSPPKVFIRAKDVIGKDTHPFVETHDRVSVYLEVDRVQVFTEAFKINKK